MRFLLVYTPKGLIEIDPDKIGGRLHKLKKSRIKVDGKWHERFTLLRIAEKIRLVDKPTGIIIRHNNWGIAMKRLGRNTVPELDVTVIKGRPIPTEFLDKKGS